MATTRMQMADVAISQQEKPAEEVTEAPMVKTFADMVNEYHTSCMMTDLKVST